MRLAVTFVACLVGCGPDSTAEDSASDETCQPPAPSDADAAHACIHAQEGPFDRVTAGTAVPGDEPLDATHTAYVVELPDAATGLVRFEPRQPGRYVAYSNAPVELSIAGSEGCVSTAVSVGACGELVAARAISASGPVDLLIRAEGLTSVLLVLEWE